MIKSRTNTGYNVSRLKVVFNFKHVLKSRTCRTFKVFFANKYKVNFTVANKFMAVLKSTNRKIL